MAANCVWWFGGVRPASCRLFFISYIQVDGGSGGWLGAAHMLGCLLKSDEVPDVQPSWLRPSGLR